jgi:hypothetical protein
VTVSAGAVDGKLKISRLLLLPQLVAKESCLISSAASGELLPVSCAALALVVLFFL